MTTTTQIDWQARAKAAYAEQVARAEAQSANYQARHAAKALGLLREAFGSLGEYHIAGEEILIDGWRFRAYEDDDWNPISYAREWPTELRGWTLQMWHPCASCTTGGNWHFIQEWEHIGAVLERPFTCDACRAERHATAPDDAAARLVAALRALLAAEA